MYANYGSKVTVIVDNDLFLPREDKDVVSAIMDNLLKQGITFIFGAKSTQIGSENGKVALSYTKEGKAEKALGSALLVATGRIPNTKSLSLDKAGVALSPRGAINVDGRLETNVKVIFALGDVNGGPQHTYVSLDDSRIIMSGLYGDGSYSRKERQNVPYSVFLDTPLAMVGLSEAEAMARGEEFGVRTLPVASIPKANVLRKPQGLYKAIISRKDHTILGVALLGAESYEVINIVKMAMDVGLKSDDLARMVFTHPTMAEALNDLFAL